MFVFFSVGLGECVQSTVNFTVDEKEIAKHNLEQARDSLAKLPILGPALWLYSNSPNKKFMFVGDMQWVLLPPVVLDQCKNKTKKDKPKTNNNKAKDNETNHARFL